MVVAPEVREPLVVPVVRVAEAVREGETEASRLTVFVRPEASVVRMVVRVVPLLLTRELTVVPGTEVRGFVVPVFLEETPVVTRLTSVRSWPALRTVTPEPLAERVWVTRRSKASSGCAV